MHMRDDRWRPPALLYVVGLLAVIGTTYGDRQVLHAAPTAWRVPMAFRKILPAVTLLWVLAIASHAPASAQGLSVWSCGRNDVGQLGLGDWDDRLLFTEATDFSGKTVTAIAGWGSHVLATTSDNKVWSWGWNAAGQLGFDDQFDREWPTEMTAFSGMTLTKLAPGFVHSIALASDGKLWGWGDNFFGELGLGDNTDRHIPTEVTFYTGKTITVVASGEYHTLVATSDGKLWACGWNNRGQLGVGDITRRNAPTEVTTLTGQTVTALAGGYQHSYALTSDGKLWAWGGNAYGQLGLGDTVNRSTPTEVTFFAGKTITMLRSGGYNALVKTSDGKVWAWGWNTSGQLGLGDVTSRSTPTEVTAFSGMTVTAMSAGYEHCAARTSDGKIWTWGINWAGQLGFGDYDDRHVPTEVPSFTTDPLTNVLAGEGYVYAVAGGATNTKPVADGQAVSTSTAVPLAITLTGSDGDADPLTYQIVSGPTSGSLTGTPPAVTYTSSDTHGGSDSFTFKVNDGKEDSDPATVTITITPVGTTLWVQERTGTITEAVTLRQYDLKRTADNALLAGRTITYKIDGTAVGTATTNAGGDSSLAWTIADGPATRTITAEFAGEPAHNASSGSAPLTAQTWGTKMVGFDRTQRITGRTELKARLLRSDNAPLYNKPIGFSVDGTFVITRPTDTLGYAKFPNYDVPAGSGAGLRPILSEWAGSGGYLAVSKTATLTVLKAPPYIWVQPKTVALGAKAGLYAYFRRLYDYQKQAGKPVTFLVDGTLVQAVTTDANGVARYLYQTVEAVGDHTIRCEFAGDAWVEAGFGEGLLRVY